MTLLASPSVDTCRHPLAVRCALCWLRAPCRTSTRIRGIRSPCQQTRHCPCQDLPQKHPIQLHPYSLRRRIHPPLHNDGRFSRPTSSTSCDPMHQIQHTSRCGQIPQLNQPTAARLQSCARSRRRRETRYTGNLIPFPTVASDSKTQRIRQIGTSLSRTMGRWP